MVNIRIIPATMRYAKAYCAAVDIVARERRYLSRTTGFSLASTKAFFRSAFDDNCPILVAVDDQDRLVGWCDIIALPGDCCCHVGRLGIGLLPAYRNHGLGGRPLKAALNQAQGRFEQVELEVLSGNGRAIRLYERFGFEQEGVRRRAFFVDGQYQDILLMNKFLQ